MNFLKNSRKNDFPKIWYYILEIRLLRFTKIFNKKGKNESKEKKRKEKKRENLIKMNKKKRKNNKKKRRF